MDEKKVLQESAKKVRAKRHEHRRKLDAIGINKLCNMVNNSSVKRVADDLGISDVTLYIYLAKNGARAIRVTRYVVDKNGGLEVYAKRD